MPLVSIIVAVYNIEAYIENCIKSIISQTAENLEILLIDDGSSDKSGEICDRYAGKDSRIRVIHKKNGGIADVRNVGLKEAKGEYFLYVDGDDYIAQNCVESALDCAEKYQADVVIFDYTEVEESTGRTDRFSVPVSENTVLDPKEQPSLLVTTPCLWNKLYRRSFWNKTGITFPAGRHYEDLTVTPMVLANAGRIVYLNSEPLYYYVLHDGSIMHSRHFEKNLRDRKAAIDDILQYFESRKLREFYETELEYLAFEHAYFVPTKEVLYYEPDSPLRDSFAEYVFGKFPDADRNEYVGKLFSKKDRLILRLMQKKHFRMIMLLSKLRKKIDMFKRKAE